ncbi:MAG TPA: DUF1697 domain-containing protein [Thermoanaerobaculia bacterium]
MPSSIFIALLRGINVGGANRVPMSELRLACEDLGWAAVQTYIQSGNVVFRAKASAVALERELERAIERRFGLSIPVLVRTAHRWSEYVARNPFPEESRGEANRVMLGLCKATLKESAVEELRARALLGERIVGKEDALWIHFPEGAGKSKLASLLDRHAGAPVTMRNWRTALQLEELAGQNANV